MNDNFLLPVNQNTDNILMTLKKPRLDCSGEFCSRIFALEKTACAVYCTQAATPRIEQKSIHIVITKLHQHKTSS